MQYKPTKVINNYEEYINNPQMITDIYLRAPYIDNSASTRCALENYFIDNPSTVFRDSVYNLLLSKPEIYNRSMLVKEPICYNFFTKEQYEVINNTNIKMFSSIDKIYNALINDTPITVTQLKLMSLYFSNNLDDKRIDSVINKFISSKKELPYEAKELIIKEQSYKVSKDYNIPCPNVVISSTNIYGNKLDDNNFGVSYDDTSIIYINVNLLTENNQYANFNNLEKAIQTVSHETRHAKQSLEAYNNIVSPSSMDFITSRLLMDYLSTEKFNEYNTNYRSNEIEMDANINGWVALEKWLNTYKPDDYQKKTIASRSNAITTQYNNSVSNKVNDKNKKYEREIFNSKALDHIIKNNPKELDKNPQLKLFYNNDGTKKNLDELITSKVNAQKNGLSSTYSDIVFNSHLTTAIKNGININLNGTNENKIDKYYELLNVGKSELKKINEGLEILNHFSGLEMLNIRDYKELDYKQMIYLAKVTNNNFKHLYEERVSRITSINNFMKLHNDEINLLKAYDLKNNNKQGFGYAIDFYQDYCHRTVNKINKYKAKTENNELEETVKHTM